jgi:short-subunit dehydrogenase
MGAVFAEKLARGGHPVLAVARRGERLRELADDLGAEGAVVEPFVADLSDAAGVAAVAERASQLDVELLVNNAGYASYGPFAELPLDGQLNLIRLNVEAVVRLTGLLLPAMRARGSGGVINVASEMSFQPMPYYATYAASKAFVLSFSEALAEELRGTGITITALAPGFVKTEFAQVAGSGRAERRMPHLDAERTVTKALRAYDRRRVVRVVGVFYRGLVLAARVTPRAAMRRLLGRLLKPANV